MLFNSLDFAIFLPIVFILFWIIPNKNLTSQNLLIVFSSYVFYGWWDWRFLSLIIFSTVVDFLVGQQLSKEHKDIMRKLLLFISLFINLGFLAIFKYYNFFLENFIEAFNLFGMKINANSLNIILPVGISFYTFQTLSYTIDVYNRKLLSTKNFLAFSAFVCFFPQLVAGPIERASNLLPQFYKKQVFYYTNISEGVKSIIYGFFLKLVIADRVAIYVNTIYNNVDAHEGLSFVLATIFFAIQIYCDFAGYSLIAIGTARLFGFKLMKNFNRPYFSFSVSEFWRRWHISLSSWFRDYLYIPLGGNKVSNNRILINILITFVISGLWHGANWTFIIWGALNGLYIIIEKFLIKKSKKNIINILITFFLICFSWIFFRANNLNDALYIIKTIFSNIGSLYVPTSDVTSLYYSIIVILILLTVEIKHEFFDTIFTIRKNKIIFFRWFYYCALIFIILYIGVFDSSQFIYFQF